MKTPVTKSADRRSAQAPGSGKTIHIELGALCDPLPKQLRGILPYEDAERLEGHSRAITRLHLYGVISDPEADRARKRLMKKIQLAVTSHRKAAAACRPNDQIHERAGEDHQ